MPPSEDSSDDEDNQESVSFEDMLEQARAQSDIYSAKEDSYDEDFEPYTFQYERMYEDSGNCSTRKESSVSSLRGDTGPSSVSSPRGDTGPNYASSPRGDSRTDSSSGMSVASQAGAGEATLGQCAIQQRQKLDATEQGQHYDARKLGQQTCNKAEQEFTQVKVEDEKDRVDLAQESR